MKNPSQPLYQPDDLSGPESNKPSPLFPPGQTIWINADDDENQDQSKQNTPSPTPLPLLPVKNPPSPSPPVESGPELARILDFETQLFRFLNDLSSQFKQLRSQVRHLDKNDFLGARLDPVMMEVSSAIREMEQACADQNPNFIPATDPAAKQFPMESRSPADNANTRTNAKFPPQHSQVSTQVEPSAKGHSPGNEAQHQTREVEPRPEIKSSPRRFKRIDRPSWRPRRPGEPNSRTILMEVEVIPSPQMRNIPPEFLDMENIQYYIPENDPTIKEQDPFGEEWDYMLEKCYSDEAVAARKAEEAARAQRLPSPARPPAATAPRNQKVDPKTPDDNQPFTNHQHKT